MTFATPACGERVCGKALCAERPERIGYASPAGAGLAPAGSEPGSADFFGGVVSGVICGSSIRISRAAGRRVQRAYLTILPLRFAFFKQRPQTLLGILQAIQFIQENVHGVAQRI